MEEKYKIHSFYILTILLTTIVLLVTIEWSTIEGLKDYISFALTVFSLGLAIIAIIYSMYSNSSLTSSLTLLETSSNKLSLTSESLSSSTNQLSETVRSIPTAIEKVETRVSETHDLVKNLELSASPSNVVGNVSEELSEEFINDFIDKLSYNGLLVLFAINFFYRHKKIFEFDAELAEAMDVDIDYAQGSFVAMYAMGLFEMKDEGSAYLIVDFHPYTDSVILKGLITKRTELFSAEEAFLKEVKQHFNRFQAYLNSKIEVESAA